MVVFHNVASVQQIRIELTPINDKVYHVEYVVSYLPLKSDEVVSMDLRVDDELNICASNEGSSQIMMCEYNLDYTNGYMIAPTQVEYYGKLLEKEMPLNTTVYIRGSNDRAGVITGNDMRKFELHGPNCTNTDTAFWTGVTDGDMLSVDCQVLRDDTDLQLVRWMDYIENGKLGTLILVNGAFLSLDGRSPTYFSGNDITIEHHPTEKDTLIMNQSVKQYTFRPQDYEVNCQIPVISLL